LPLEKIKNSLDKKQKKFLFFSGATGYGTFSAENCSATSGLEALALGRWSFEIFIYFLVDGLWRPLP